MDKDNFIEKQQLNKPVTNSESNSSDTLKETISQWEFNKGKRKDELEFKKTELEIQKLEIENDKLRKEILRDNDRENFELKKELWITLSKVAGSLTLIITGSILTYYGKDVGMLLLGSGTTALGVETYKNDKTKLDSKDNQSENKS